ncbi:MAG: IS630 family transposase [Aestuariivirga sp.]
MHASEQDRPDVAAARQAHIEAQGLLPLPRLHFVDETGVATNLVRRYGRALAGQRLIGKTPHGRWQIVTCIAALRLGGIPTLATFNGAMNGELFVGFVKKFLAPILKPGDIVIWDNLQVHKNKAAIAAIEARGASVMPLPAYSPDLNPIEKAFAKLKALLRKARPRTRRAIDRHIARIFKAFTPQECRAYFKSCGYSN